MEGGATKALPSMKGAFYFGRSPVRSASKGQMIVRIFHRGFCVPVEERTLKDKIVAIRGQQVMLDFDLAKIYGYTTKAFNQQVQRNIDRFPEDFLFRLTTEEVVNLRSQNVTSSWGGSRYPPFAFTEQGIYMLMITPKDYFALAATEQLGHCRCAVSFFAQLVLPLHALGLTGHGQRRILQSNN